MGRHPYRPFRPFRAGSTPPPGWRSGRSEAGNPMASKGGARMSIDLSSVVSRNEAIVFTDLDDSVVMMDVDEGQYYELDPVASRIWALIGTGRSVAEICDVLAGEYEVEPDTCRRDTLEFLQAAWEQRLVRVRPAGA